MVPKDIFGFDPDSPREMYAEKMRLIGEESRKLKKSYMQKEDIMKMLDEATEKYGTDKGIRELITGSYTQERDIMKMLDEALEKYDKGISELIEAEKKYAKGIKELIESIRELGIGLKECYKMYAKMEIEKSIDEISKSIKTLEDELKKIKSYYSGGQYAIKYDEDKGIRELIKEYTSKYDIDGGIKKMYDTVEEIRKALETIKKYKDWIKV